MKRAKFGAGAVEDADDTPSVHRAVLDAPDTSDQQTALLESGGGGSPSLSGDDAPRLEDKVPQPKPERAMPPARLSANQPALQ